MTLPGFKTYLTVAVGIGYLVGVKAGFWRADTDLLAAIGLAAVAFLRAGIAKLPPSTPA